MKIRHALVLGTAVAVCALAQSGIDVGSGSPNDTIRFSFVNAYFRNLFYTLVSVPPLSEVKRFGTTGYVQEFGDAAKTTGVKLALVKPNGSVITPEGTDVLQVLAPMYAYYSSVGVNTAGYPTNDTQACPPTAEAPCQYQLFDKPYALFAYLQPIANGSNFAVREPFFSKWREIGGVGVLGPANSAETTVTSRYGSVATVQTFSQGALVNITSGALNGRFVAVQPVIYAFWIQNGGAAGTLGFPVNEEGALANGLKRQSFEGGSVEYGPSSGTVLRPPVNSVSVTQGGATLRLNLNDTVQLRATAYSASGIELTDRTIIFTTTNSRVATVQSNGPVATLRAVGAGIARIAAVSEGKSSPLIDVIVTAPCCSIGEGAPSAVIQQAFQDAVSRNRLAVRVPSPGPVRRMGAGYVQELASAGLASQTRYLVAIADRSSVAYVVYGEVLTRYEAAGGPLQSLGYPTSDVVFDARNAPRQSFQGGAIAGIPARLVTGLILQRWFLNGFEAGPAGQPASEAVAFTSASGLTAVRQVFQNLEFFEVDGAVIPIAGEILTAYRNLGGPEGALGLPLDEEIGVNGRRRQEFETAYLEYGPGEQAAIVEKTKRPQISASPSEVLPGGGVRLSLRDFPPEQAVRVSVQGQPDFDVTPRTGAFYWDFFVAANAAPGLVRVRAAQGSSTSSETTFAIRSMADARLQLVKVAGDEQSGVPGALLPQRLRVVLRDETGNPLPNMPIRFTPGPGGEILNAGAATNERGEAEASLRLPPRAGIALATAEGGRQVVTFSARAQRASLPNFPAFKQSGDLPLGSGPGTIAQKGSLLTAAAAVIRYYQDRGEAPQANGLATPTALNEFLRTFCASGSTGEQICDGFIALPGLTDTHVNLWRSTEFVDNALEFAGIVPQTVQDHISSGIPVILALALTIDGAPPVAHFIVATGVNDAGAVLIADPSPTFNRTTLSEYLDGFVVNGRAVKASVTGAVRVRAASRGAFAFVIASTAQRASLTSASGPCGVPVPWPQSVATPAGGVGNGAVLTQQYCDGNESVYQADLGSDTSFGARVTGLTLPASRFDISGGGAASFRIAEESGRLSVRAQALELRADGVVNAANFSPELAPGSLAALSGAGFTADATIEIDGRRIVPTLISPFEIRLAMPADLEPGPQILRLTTSYGSVGVELPLLKTAPAIFNGGIINADGSVNRSTSPARRGSIITIYATGLGATTRVGPNAVALEPVTVILDAVREAVEVPAQFAGAAPGFPGVYQINVNLPGNIVPARSMSIALKQGDRVSPTAGIAVQ